MEERKKLLEKQLSLERRNRVSDSFLQFTKAQAKSRMAQKEVGKVNNYIDELIRAKRDCTALKLNCMHYETEIAQERQARDDANSEYFMLDSLLDFRDSRPILSRAIPEKAPNPKTEKDLLARLRSLELEIRDFDLPKSQVRSESAAALSISRLSELEIEQWSLKRRAIEMRVSHLKATLDASTTKIAGLEDEVSRLRMRLLRIETEEPVDHVPNGLVRNEGKELDRQIASLERQIDETAMTFDAIESGLPPGADDAEDWVLRDSLVEEVAGLEAKLGAMKSRHAAEHSEQRELMRLLYARLRSNRQLIRAWNESAGPGRGRGAAASPLSASDSFSLRISSSSDED
jgi:hypothetical protein